MELAKCMNCKKEWCYDYIIDSFQNMFLKEYKKHIGRVLFENEKSQISKYANSAIIELKRKKVQDKLRSSCIILKSLLDCYENSDPPFEEKHEILSRISIQRVITRGLRKELREIKWSGGIKVDIKYCCSKECNGLLENNICLVCGYESCKKCNEIIFEKNHVCDSNNLESIKLICENYMRCPCCDSAISKIEGGCDQMFCINCKTAFSWKSGKIDEGRIHNPHYYEYLREKNGILEKENVECHNYNYDLIPFVIRENKLYKVCSVHIKRYRPDIIKQFNIKEKRNPMRVILKTLLRGLDSIIHDEIPYWNNVSDNNSDIMISYILDNSLEENSKIRLRRRYIRNYISSKIIEYLETYVVLLDNILRKLWNLEYLKYNVNDVLLILENLKEIRYEFNKIFGDISKTFNCYCPYISNTYHIYDVRVGMVRGQLLVGDISLEQDGF
tara:strand:- start:26667 stop:27998 length:1332 start_codon:yes stop_codon:yes gene_type:complete